LYLGRSAKYSRKSDHFINQEALRLFRYFALKSEGHPSVRQLRRIYRNFENQTSTPKRSLILSWESFSLNLPQQRLQMARRIHKVFGPSQILLTIRNPVSLVASTYSQYIKRTVFRAPKGEFPDFLGINEWINRGLDSDLTPGHHLDYFRTIQLYSKIFGPQKVHISLYEELVENPKSFINSTCQVLDIDPVEAFQLIRDKSANVRFSKCHLIETKRIRQNTLLANIFKRGRYQDRLKMIGFDGSVDPGNRGLAEDLKQSTRCRIEDLTREGNHCLVEKYGLPLIDYGYPV
jgi:hypothetical protein